MEESTADEHLRSLARMSSFLRFKDFTSIRVEDALGFKDELRSLRDEQEKGALSATTVAHIVGRCDKFFRWLTKQQGVTLTPDLPGYFSLSRKETAASSDASKGTNLTFDLALCIFKAMPHTSPIELRNRAIVAMFIVTGMRIAALVSLRGKHVNLRTRWINQDPKEVDTKFSKHIRTYCLNLGSRLMEALEEWNGWRSGKGFGDNSPFFLPDRYIQPNALGYGYRGNELDEAQCWQSPDPVQQIIKSAALNAGVLNGAVSSHDFRKVFHPFLSVRGKMLVREEVALELNHGQKPGSVMRKHYAAMNESDRQEILDDLCRRALTDRSELDLYLGYERGEIAEANPDFRRAKDLYERNSRTEVV